MLHVMEQDKEKGIVMKYREKIDYSSLSTYIECPRKFMFQYMFHFRGSRKNIHLIFGGAWHYGLVMTYKQLQKDPDSLTIIDATELSRISFNQYWQLEGAEAFPDEDIIFPKSPGHAANMYHEYWKRYLTLDQEDEKKILAVETPFAIALDTVSPNLPMYIGRQDLIFQNANGGLEVMDHKTAKAIYPTTLTSFEMSFQTEGYLTAASLFYNKIPSITYSVALCQKSKIAFHRYNIIKRKKALEQFMQDLVFYTDELIYNINLMEKDIELYTERNDHITSFRRRPGNACSSFMSPCSYMDICKVRNNPLLWKDSPPQGYSINEWDPETHEEEIKKALENLS